MTNQLYIFAVILLSIFTKQLLAQAHGQSVSNCTYNEKTINNIINGIVRESKKQPNVTFENDFLFTNMEDLKTDLSNCSNIQEYINEFGTAPSLLQRATEAFLWLWGLPLRIFTSIIDSILDAMYDIIGGILDTIINWFTKQIRSGANNLMDFNLTWLTKFYDALYPRIYDAIVTIGPGIVGGFLLLLIPNYADFSGEITEEIVTLVKDLTGPIKKILNPLSLIPGGSLISKLLGGGSSGSKSESSSGSQSNTTKSPPKSNWLSWLG